MTRGSQRDSRSLFSSSRADLDRQERGGEERHADRRMEGHPHVAVEGVELDEADEVAEEFQEAEKEHRHPAEPDEGRPETLRNAGRALQHQERSRDGPAEDGDRGRASRVGARHHREPFDPAVDPEREAEDHLGDQRQTEPA